MGISKWIAGALGWAILGPIGGILAYWLASRAEETAEQNQEQAMKQGQRNSFLMSLLVLSAAVIKADGKTTSQEVAKLREFFTKNFGRQAGIEAEDIVKGILEHCILKPLSELQKLHPRLWTEGLPVA